MSSQNLTPDTQAILLLCASFGHTRDLYPQPLSLKEYNNLAKWLQDRQLRPFHLLESNGQAMLTDCTMLDPARLCGLLDRGMMLAIAVEKWMSQGLWILGRGDKLYPPRLKQQLGENSPALLYGVGDINLLSEGGLAVVGSRNIDEEGIAYTERLADICARQGIQTVSGGARGVDTVAMLAALTEGGTAVGVLADSLAKSAVSMKYRSPIVENRLTLVSAVDPQAGFNVGNAMARNKYIYALADRGLVINADYNKGGTWAGAIEALTQKKSIPLFVRIEGNISPGNKQLLKHGAKPFPNQPWEKNLTERMIEIINKEPAEPEMVQGSFFAELAPSSYNYGDSKLQIEDISADKIKSVIVSNSIYDAVLPIIINHLQ
jgi:predicted Rossmann fold nucleotide-binding protein DprA/Smf involved in DNA uptake